jgi:hypothetical protein
MPQKNSPTRLTKPWTLGRLRKSERLKMKASVAMYRLRGRPKHRHKHNYRCLDVYGWIEFPGSVLLVHDESKMKIEIEEREKRHLKELRGLKMQIE